MKLAEILTYKQGCLECMGEVSLGKGWKGKLLCSQGVVKEYILKHLKFEKSHTVWQMLIVSGSWGEIEKKVKNDKGINLKKLDLKTAARTLEKSGVKENLIRAVFNFEPK